jgi:four helix bundle protein
MKYERFEELSVWQAATDLAVQIFAWSSHSWFRGKGDLANQIQRAALSISNNIAEGFERGSTNELLQFIYIARGSAGEVRSMFCVVEFMDAPEDLRSQISNLKSLAEGISRQLRGWANSLQNSDIQGQRHLNDQSKKVYDNRNRSDNFRKQIQSNVEQAQQQREEQQKKATNPPPSEYSEISNFKSEIPIDAATCSASSLSSGENCRMSQNVAKCS